MHCFFQKETPAQVLSCEFCKTFENIIITEHLQEPDSVFMEHIFNIKKRELASISQRVFSRNKNYVNVRISSFSSLLTLSKYG